MIDFLIEGIQSGDLTNNKILETLTKYKAEQVTAEEFNEAIDQIEAAEGKHTLLELSLSNANQRADATEATLIEAEGAMAKLRAAMEKVMNNGKTQAAEVIRLRVENKTSKQNAKEVKALKKNKADAFKKSQEREKRLAALEADNKAYRREASAKELEIARLRMSGQKIIGEFRFTLFPSKIDTIESGTAHKRVGLVAFTEPGTMKIVRADKDGRIVQPDDSEPFDFCEESKQFIRDFSNVAIACDNQFTDSVLKMVN